MQLSATTDSKMRRMVEKHKFYSWSSANDIIRKAEREIQKHGALSFIDAMCLVENGRYDTVMRRIYFPDDIYQHMDTYGWKRTSDWTVACIHPNDPEKRYWKLVVGLPVRINEKYYRFPDLHEGDRIHIKEYGLNSRPEVGCKQTVVMTYNKTVPIGRHHPDYCEFVGEYPNYVVIRAHFESNGGESYCDCIPNWALRSGKVKITLEEDD